MWRQSPINALFDFLLSDRAHKQTRTAALHLQNSLISTETLGTLGGKEAEFLIFLRGLFFKNTFNILFFNYFNFRT